MRRVNMWELHPRTGTIIDRVAGEDVMVIEERDAPVAELRPTVPATKGFSTQHWKRLKKLPKLEGDSGRFISSDRDRG